MSDLLNADSTTTAENVKDLHVRLRPRNAAQVFDTAFLTDVPGFRMIASTDRRTETVLPEAW
jgi:hypothetical protein